MRNTALNEEQSRDPLILQAPAASLSYSYGVTNADTRYKLEVAVLINALQVHKPSLPTRVRWWHKSTGELFEAIELIEVAGGRSTTPHFRITSPYSRELEHEWPEVAKLADKLKRNESLDGNDIMCLNELTEVTGWSENDIIDDLKNVDADPSERVEKYREILEKYFHEALEWMGKGDTRQAAEKLWGAITALIKLYAAKKGIPIMHWGRGRMERFVTNNVEPQHRKLFRDLLDKGHTLHEHFYEGYLDAETFEERWEELKEALKKAKDLVL